MKISTNWMTSFFYKEDLRSEYMNGLLDGAFRPGVYNGNFVIFADDTSVKLFVKKGTTLLFGNCYEKRGGRYYLNPDSLAGTYLIKCTARTDLVEDLLTLSKTTTPSLTVRSLLGYKSQDVVEKVAPRTSFVFADILYNAEKTTETGAIEPRFRMCLPNENIDEGYYYCPDVAEDADPINKITENMTTRVLDHSYLFLGALEDVNYAPDKVYLTGYSWSGDLRNDWISSHRFVARGLPEFRGNYLKTSTVRNPEIFLGVSRRNLFLDATRVSVEDKIYTEVADWRESLLSDTGEPSNFSLKTYTQDDFENLYTDRRYVLIDVGFLGTRAKYSEKEPSLNNILEKDTSTLKKITYSFITPVDDSDTSKDPTKKAYDPTREVEDTSGAELSHTNYSTEDSVFLKGNEIIPLDMNSVNISRLLDIISNKNIFSTIINKMVYDDLVDPSEITTLSPLFIAFRKIKYNDDKKEWESVIPQDSKFLSEVHPSNFLSFLDLQTNSNKTQTLRLNRTDVYTVLPLID